jgi:hypothetical protein
MVTKNFLWPALLAGVIGIPFMTSQDHGSSEWEMQPALSTSDLASQYSLQPSYQYPTGPDFLQTSATSVPALPLNLNGQASVILPGDANSPDLNAMPLAFVPVANFAEVIRLDANSAWVKSRWERISVFTTGDGLTAFRCDLVTGVNQGDLHGCLTYFFDRQDKVAKISFRGWCGDPSPIKNFAITSWNLEPKDGKSTSVFVARSWRISRGALILQNAPIIRRDQPLEQVAVFFEVAAPDFRDGISREMCEAIDLVN